MKTKAKNQEENKNRVKLFYAPTSTMEYYDKITKQWYDVNGCELMNPSQWVAEDDIDRETMSFW